MEGDASNVREAALQNAAQAVKALAVSSQQKAIEYLQARINEIDEFLHHVDNNLLIAPQSATLFVALASLFTSNLHISYEQARQTVASSGIILFQQIQSFETRNVSEQIYNGLKIYFPESESELPSLFPNFTPSNIEKLGPIPENLYNWLDATFSLLQIYFD